MYLVCCLKNSHVTSPALMILPFWHESCAIWLNRLWSSKYWLPKLVLYIFMSWRNLKAKTASCQGRDNILKFKMIGIIFHKQYLQLLIWQSSQKKSFNVSRRWYLLLFNSALTSTGQNKANSFFVLDNGILLLRFIDL